jgi:uncharacterized protein (TIGR03437 family)
LRLLLRRLILGAASLPCFLLLSLTSLTAQPRAILADGSGPWQTAQWAFTVSQFSALLADAGYSVTTVSPVDLPSLIPSRGTLVAIPSLASLPFATFTAIAAHVSQGGSLMASGGPPFSDALYLTPGGQWLDSAAYLQAVGSSPPQGSFTPPYITTLSPASQEQYTNSAGLQVPIARNRGIFSMSYDIGRYRAIGDLLAPAATLFEGNGVIVWLPWPQLFEPLRAQLVSALEGSSSGLYFVTAGADQIVWLPGEAITGGESIVNHGASAVQPTLQWSIVSASGSITPQPAVPLSLDADGFGNVRFNIGSLPVGDYTITFRLMVGNQEMDRVDSPVRVLDPTLTRQPSQKIRAVNGAFSTAAGQHVFLQGVNYWPRYTVGIGLGESNGQSWFEANQYDPDLVEADLTEIAALGFNLLNIQFSEYISGWAPEGRAVIDFLERCRNHGLWARIFLSTTFLNGAYNGQISPTLDNYLQSAFLPGNDRVFAYELLWEPMIGMHDSGGAGEFVNDMVTGANTGRTLLDPDWRAWVNDRYGSLANAEQAWSFTAPLDATGQLTNPLDDQIENDGPWRIMVAAYRRFLEDYLGRNIGVIARQIRRTDPDTLLTYRNWTTMNEPHNTNTGYDIGTGAAHLDFFSPERYSPVLLWPDDRPWGLVTAYSRYRTGGKPVQWTEFGADVSTIDGSSTSQATQGAICDTMMRQVADDGSNAATVWWWPGGSSPISGTDFGIIDPDGTPRPCASDLSQWNATFAAAAPDLTSDPPTTITVDRDADARGSYGLFLNYQNSYLQARQAGMSVVLADAGTGTDTSTMPVIQVGDVPYTGTGPLKFADAEFAGIHVVCPTLDVTVENGSSVAVPPGAACQFTPTLVNTGEAQWLPGSAPKGGVILQTSAGNLPLTAPLQSLQRTPIGTLNVTMGQSPVALTGRTQVVGLGGFGEALNLTLTPDPNSGGACPISLSSNGPISAPSAGVTGTVNVTAPSTCGWTAVSSELWLTFNPGAGSGNGAVPYNIAANSGPVRQTTIGIANHPFTVTQNAVANPVLLPAPTLSAGSLNFGNQTIGVSTGAQSVTFTNSGTAAVNLSAVAIGGLNSGDFAQTNDCGSALAASTSCTVQVTFTPSDAGMRTASLYVGGSVSGGPQAVTLSGAGMATGPIPAIQAAVDAWGYTAGIAPGLWVSLGGTNLGGAPQTWSVPGTQLPVTVGDVSVTFNSLPAAISYVSGPQVNVLVPAGVPPGPVQVVVEAYGANSSAFSMTANATHPAVYALPTADGSTFFVTAALAGTATLIGNSAVDSRVVRAAYPGDTLDLYMIGLGATLDPADFITNQVFAGAFPLAAPVAVSVGGEPANVLFSGLTSPGLYLVRIAVPSDLAAGPQPLQVTAGGVPTRPSLVLQVALPPPA